MKTREGDRDWYVLAAFAGLVAVVWLFALRPLIYAPGDRARVARIVPRPATRAVDPGPVEASLYRLADAHRRLSLLIDTTKPEDDPKSSYSTRTTGRSPRISSAMASRRPPSTVRSGWR